MNGPGTRSEEAARLELAAAGIHPCWIRTRKWVFLQHRYLLFPAPTPAGVARDAPLPPGSRPWLSVLGAQFVRGLIPSGPVALHLGSASFLMAIMRY